MHSRSEDSGEHDHRPARSTANAEADLEDFPDLEDEDIYAALEFAAAVVHERELPVVPSL